MENNFSNYTVIQNGDRVAIFSKKRNRTLKTKVTKNGYRMITVKDDFGMTHTFTFARFVLMLTDPREDYTNLEVDHINRNSMDDRIRNLRWVTKEENRLNRDNQLRPHRNVPIVIWDHNTGDYYKYTYANKDQFPWPYMTVYTLANAKQGSHYSMKYNITCNYESKLTPELISVNDTEPVIIDKN